MPLTCPHCRQVLHVTGKRPSFCAYCGKPLPSEVPTTLEETTADIPRQAGGPQDDPPVVGGYRLLRLLGTGGMGRVYEAKDGASGRHVALKLIGAEYADSTDAVERFRREGRLASTLVHPRCVFVYAADEEAGRPYIAMELMTGGTLQDLLDRRGPLRPEEALPLILDVIEGLNEAHRLGVIHRDVKPSNCFIEPDGRVKVGDFGLSKSLVEGAHLTRTGSFIGTPLYAAPEQVKGEATGPQADVYSVAATLYCLLTGRAPFQGGDLAATLARIVSEPAPSLRTVRPDLPAPLDRVVLRGLERDRSRRWRDLDELRAGLLPLLPGRVAYVGLGLRFGAFLVDYLLLTLIGAAAGAFVLWLVGESLTDPRPSTSRMAAGAVAGLLLLVLYFGIPEGLWGFSLGKRWLGLRVCLAGSGEPPGLARSLLRSLVFWGLYDFGSLVLWVLHPSGPIEPMGPGQAFSLLGLHYSLWLAGIGLLLGPMRARNGYRGLHEFASGTRVVRLWRDVRQRPFGVRGGKPAPRPGDLPERIGAFTVTGMVRREGSEAVLLGEDVSLGRKVLLWLRPEGSPPLEEVRREINRTTRLRWVGCGRHGEQPWDAFPAPAGTPLAELVAGRQRLSWTEAGPLLVQLADELAAAAEDGTLPTPLAPEQVWVDPGGRVQLVEMAVPLGPGSGTMPEAVALVRRVALLALGGAAPPARSAPPPPLYATALLDRLRGEGLPCEDVRPLRADLVAAVDRPAVVTRARRLAHLAVQALFLSLGLCCQFALPALPNPSQILIISDSIEENVRLQERMDNLAATDMATALDRDPVVRLAALEQLRSDLDLGRNLREQTERLRREREARLQAGSGLSRDFSRLNERQQTAPGAPRRPPRQPFPSDPSEIRSSVQGELARARPRSAELMLFPTVATMMLLVWSAVWVAWAFLWRGGLSFRMLGLALVGSDGRPARRLRCAWRALLFWVPLVVLAAVSVWLDAAYWADWPGAPAWLLRASEAAWWAVWGVLLVSGVLAVWSPARAWQDRLARTWLVPR
jgi:eukaryotic-like serine/threonine-protein kinase